MFFGPDGKKLWMIQTNKVPPVVPREGTSCVIHAGD
jgi:hypothetical protein